MLIVSLKNSNFLKEQLVEKFKLLVELKRKSNHTWLKNVLWMIQKWNKMAELHKVFPDITAVGYKISQDQITHLIFVCRKISFLG